MTYVFAALRWSKQQIKRFCRRPSLLAFNLWPFIENFQGIQHVGIKIKLQQYVKCMYSTLDSKNTILQTWSSIISIAHYLVKWSPWNVLHDSTRTKPLKFPWWNLSTAGYNLIYTPYKISNEKLRIQVGKSQICRVSLLTKLAKLGVILCIKAYWLRICLNCVLRGLVRWFMW